jgi:hypothetical protein
MERVVDGLVAVTHEAPLPALVVCHRGWSAWPGPTPTAAAWRPSCPGT